MQIEVHLSCALSTRQKKLYQALKQRISIDDLLQSSLAPTSRDSSSSHLLNLVMQFRKVCLKLHDARLGHVIIRCVIC